MRASAQCKDRRFKSYTFILNLEHRDMSMTTTVAPPLGGSQQRQIKVFGLSLHTIFVLLESLLLMFIVLFHGPGSIISRLIFVSCYRFIKMLLVTVTVISGRWIVWFTRGWWRILGTNRPIMYFARSASWWWRRVGYSLRGRRGCSVVFRGCGRVGGDRFLAWVSHDCNRRAWIPTQGIDCKITSKIVKARFDVLY